MKKKQREHEQILMRKNLKKEESESRKKEKISLMIKNATKRNSEDSITITSPTRKGFGKSLNIATGREHLQRNNSHFVGRTNRDEPFNDSLSIGKKSDKF